MVIGELRIGFVMKLKQFVQRRKLQLRGLFISSRKQWSDYVVNVNYSENLNVTQKLNV